MEDGSPDWHLSRPMCRHNVFAQDGLPYACRRKLPSVLAGQQREIGYLRLQRGRDWTCSFSIRAMTRCAIHPEQVRSLDRANERRKLLVRGRRGLSLRIGLVKHDADE